MNDLSVLIEHQGALLLAEVAAWLHDMGKCTEAFLNPGGIGFNATICRGNPHINPHKAILSPSDLERLPYWARLSPDRGRCARLEEANHPTSLWRTLQRIGEDLNKLGVIRLPVGSIDLRELILWGRPLVSSEYRNFTPILGERTHLAALLGWAHKTAHMEKEDEADGRTADGIDSPFGFQSPGNDIRRLDNKLKDVLEALLKARTDFLRSVRINFTRAPGDTRYPINEVTLWDWSSIAASLYKAELARCVLTGTLRQPKEVAWHLLSIRTDGLGYLLSASTIPDMLARKALLTDAWNRVQTLLEETYPLGLEVYRDEDGSLFVVPDIENIMFELVDIAADKNLHQLILDTFDEGTVQNNRCLRVNGEIVPGIYSDSQSWNGQSPNGLPPVGEHLQRIPPLTSNSNRVADAWCGRREQVCTACGLRPQGPSQKAKDRGLCDICEQRRGERSKAWATKHLETTIWLGEVADINGRFALLVGRFDLEHWLDGSLVRTLAVRKPDDTNGHTANEAAKNPSFARIRRIWETTKRFWEEITGDLGEIVGQAGPRLEILGTLSPSSLGLGPYHLYELVIGQRHLPVVWDSGQARFITADNLAYIARLLEDKVVDHEKAAGVIAGHLQGKQWLIEEPIGYGAKNKKLGTLSIQDVHEMNSRYTPAIPILAEPRTFMAIVPANRALAVAEAIKTKYEREMGKVRNRLPLHLGIVYAQRHMPLRTLLDAGRRMLRQKAIEPMDQWRVIEDVHKQTGSLPEEVRDLAARSEQFEQWYVVRLQHLTSERSITWYVPAVMGDGKTEDDWYPYVFVKSFASARSTPSRWFKATNPWTGQDDGILVHVAELRTGDVVYFTPATLDFIWLDSAGRRFEIAYEGNGHRKDLPRRPYLLDELETLESIWRTLADHLTTTQLHALSSLIEGKREAWGSAPSDETFKQFCRALLANLEWRKKDGAYPWGNDREAWLDTWADYAVRGWIADAVELHHHIMKESGKA